MIVCPPILSTVASGRMRKSGADSVAFRSPSSVSEPSSSRASSSGVMFDIYTSFVAIALVRDHATGAIAPRLRQRRRRTRHAGDDGAPLAASLPGRLVPGGVVSRRPAEPRAVEL